MDLGLIERKVFMEIKLPLAESYIDALQYHAYFSSIVMTKDNFKYMLSKYINITVRSIFKPHIDFCYQGILDLSPSPLNKFQIRGKIMNITEFIISALRSGNYVYVKVNEFYLPHRISYKKEMFVHDILVYGVDNSNKLFYTYGYDDTKKLNHTTHTFDEIEKSYYSLTYEWDYDLFLIRENNDYSFNNLDEIILQEYRNYSLSVNPYYKTINKVINGEDGGANEPINISSFDVYGIKCYDFVINILNDHIHNNASFDSRTLFVLKNQKKTIRDSLLLMNCNNSDMSKKYGQIYKETEICAMLYLKYKNAQDKKILSDLIFRLKQIKEEEISFFERFFKE